MALTPDQLSALISRLVADSALWHTIVHGGPADTVETEGGERPSIAKALADLAGGLVSAFSATSTSEVVVGTGAKVFTIAAGKLFQPGMPVVVRSAGDPTLVMYGDVVSLANTVLTVDVTAGAFAGSADDWTIAFSGPRGEAGIPGLEGEPGPSAYQVAVANGFAGDQVAWLASLHGADGASDFADITGAPGDNVALAAALSGKQGAHANLTALAGLALVANKLIYANGAGTLGLADLTAFARTLLDDADATTMLSTLGVSAFAKTLLDDTDASTALSTLGVSAFVKTLLDDANASTALSTLGVSTFIKTLLDDADGATARATIGAASPADIATAIANLVASSPSTLDTLNELAAALGNDPNFATTVTNLIATKQAAHANLTALSALVFTADKMIYGTGAGTVALATLTAFARTLLDDADASTALSTLGFSAFFKTLLPVASSSALLAALGAREQLTAARSYFVRTAPVPVTITIATPAVVTRAAHGLANNAPVVLSVLPNRTSITMTAANPCVVSWAGHGLTAGQPVIFNSTGRLPVGVTKNTVYYVSATGLTTDTFQFSATSGGASVAGSAPAVTVTIASPGVFTLASHGLAVGDIVAFATTGALPTGLTANTLYYVKTVPSGNTFTVAATADGTAINTSGSQSGTHTLVQIGSHIGSLASTLPTGLVAGTVYYAKNVTTNTYQLSATPGGAAIATSGSAAGLVWAQTGNDANDGLSAGSPLLWTQTAINKAAGYDFNGNEVTINVADGMYLENLTGKSFVGDGRVNLVGNLTIPANVMIAGSGTVGFAAPSIVGKYSVKGFAFNGTNILNIGISASGGVTNLEVANVEFLGGWTVYLQSSTAAVVTITGPCNMMPGGVQNALSAASNGKINQGGIGFTINIYDNPTWGSAGVSVDTTGIVNLLGLFPITVNGPAKGQRYAVTNNAILNSGGVTLPGSLTVAPTNGGIYV